MALAACLLGLVTADASADSSSYTELWIDPGEDVAAARSRLEHRLAWAGIPVLEVEDRGKKGLKLRVDRYWSESTLRPLIEVQSMLSVMLVDDRTKMWRKVPESPGGGVLHLQELQPDGHRIWHTVTGEKAKLRAYLDRVPVPDRRIWLVGPAAEGHRAVLVVAPPVMPAVVLEEVSVAAGKLKGTSVVSVRMRSEDAAGFGDVSSVHRGHRLALALEDRLLDVVSLEETVRDGHLLLRLEGADRSRVDTVAESLRATKEGSGMKLSRMVLK